MLPYWDWTYIYEQDCLIDNPYYEDQGMSKESCKVCKNLTEVERLDRASQEEIAQEFLFDDIPVIVTDAMNDWLTKDKFTIDGILKVQQ